MAKVLSVIVLLACASLASASFVNVQFRGQDANDPVAPPAFSGSLNGDAGTYWNDIHTQAPTMPNGTTGQLLMSDGSALSTVTVTLAGVGFVDTTYYDAAPPHRRCGAVRQLFRIG